MIPIKGGIKAPPKKRRNQSNTQTVLKLSMKGKGIPKELARKAKRMETFTEF